MTAQRPVSVAPLLTATLPIVLGVMLACASSESSSTSDSATAVPAAAAAPAAAPAGVVPGIEVLLTDSMHLIRGNRVGLITNHSGKNRADTSTIDLLYKAPDVKLTALFGPEHGLRGAAQAGDPIESTVDSATGVPSS